MAAERWGQRGRRKPHGKGVDEKDRWLRSTKAPFTGIGSRADIRRFWEKG
jgi:hypothetical protein